MHTKDQHTCYLSCRLSRRLNAKLNTLTDATGRSRSDVLRWLILQARLQDLPKGWVETAAEESRLHVSVQQHRRRQSRPPSRRLPHVKAIPDAQGLLVKGSPRSPQSKDQVREAHHRLHTTSRPVAVP
jgi:predicted DNA-binding protein